MKIIHLPFYEDNSYQSELMNALREVGVTTESGGGGGTFFRSALRRWKADILHFHWLHPYMIRSSATQTIVWSLLLIAQILVLKARNTKIVWTAHNIQSHESPFPELERRLQRHFVRQCDAVIAHCESAKKEVMHVFGLPANKVYVVPHGNYVDSYLNITSQDEARLKLGLPADATVICFLGQIRPYKGVLELVDAFRQLLKDIGGARQPYLIIAGKPRDEATSEQIYKAVEGCDRILFVPGFVPDNEIQTYMNACDVVVFPYRDILTSGAVLLAMSFGRACIAPRRGCIGETLDAEGGFLYAPEEAEGLIEALRTTLLHSNQLNIMGQHNLERVQQWNWASVARQTNDVYQRVLKR